MIVGMAKITCMSQLYVATGYIQRGLCRMYDTGMSKCMQMSVTCECRVYQKGTQVVARTGSYKIVVRNTGYKLRGTCITLLVSIITATHFY